MTTRHTISHADELYSGNAYNEGYSPDGRRGIKMTHLYAHEFLSTAGVPATLGDIDGILSSYATPSLIGPTGAFAANFLAACSGALTGATGATILEFDVPRNIVFTCCGNSTGVYLKVLGLDAYGQPMAESIQGASQTAQASGQRCFKSIHTLYSTAKFPAGSPLSMGTGNRLGLPFNLAKKGKLISVSYNGRTNTSGATGAYVVFIGASAATTIDTTNGSPDVRGSVKIVAPALDGSAQFTALMMVDHTTNRKAFGPPQVTACSNGVG